MTAELSQAPGRGNVPVTDSRDPWPPIYVSGSSLSMRVAPPYNGSMQIKDAAVLSLVEQIADHYKRNISNRFLRPALLRVQLEQHDMELIESVTEKSEYYRLQGYHPDELYDRIVALAEFIYHARKDVGPNLRNLLSSQNGKVLVATGNERVLRDLSVNNFQSNLSILADLVNKLYVMVVQIDENSSRGTTPVYRTVPRLKEIGKLLVPR